MQTALFPTPENMSKNISNRNNPQKFFSISDVLYIIVEVYRKECCFERSEP